MNFCPDCFAETEEDICPVCGYDSNVKNAAPALPAGFMADERYLLGRVVSSDSEGFTYLAKDTFTGKKVFVREFFPATLAERNDGRTTITEGCKSAYERCAAKFAALWKGLKNLNGLTGIIKVLRLFYADGILLSVYEYEESVSLREYLYSQELGMLSYEESRRLFMPLLASVSALHAEEIYHLGINASTVRVRPDGTMYLDGFGISDVRRVYGELNPDITPGFAAEELYDPEKFCGPWTDVYALAVTFIYCMTGIVIPPAEVIASSSYVLPQTLIDKLPVYVTSALLWAIASDPSERLDSAEKLRLAFLGKYEKPFDYESAYRSATEKKTAPLSPSMMRELETALPPVGFNPERHAVVTEPKKLNSTAATRSRMQKPAPYISAKTADDKADTATSDVPVLPNVSPKASVNRTKEPTPQQVQLYSKKNRTGLIVLVIFIVALLGVGLVVLIGPDININIVDSPSDAPTAPVTEEYTFAPVADTVQVPNFVGLDQNKVMADAEARKILNIDYQEEYNRTVPEGEIMRQSLAGGSDVQPHTTVILYVSLGPQPYVIEEFRGTSADSAKEYLEAKGLTVVIEPEENTGDAVKDTVAGISPGTGETVHDGDSVTLYVYGEVATTQPPTTKPPESEPEKHGQDKGFFEVILDYLFG